MSRFFILLVFVLFGSATVSACTCIGTLQETYRRAKLVFEGRVDSIGPEAVDPKFGGQRMRAVTFTVVKKWKGSMQDKVTVFTNHAPNPCYAFVFQEGETYLVYARKNMYATSDCGESKEANTAYAKEEMKKIDSFWFRLKARRWWPF